MQIHRVGVRWNPLQGQSPRMLAPCLLSINAIYEDGMLLGTTAVAKAAGHSAFWLWGTQAARIGWKYGQVPFGDYVRDLADYLDVCLNNARRMGCMPDMVGGHNEQNVDYYAWRDRGEDGVGRDPEQIRQVDRALHAVCQKHGVPYAVGSTLGLDWNSNNGIADFLRVYPRGTAIPGEVIDVHLYAADVSTLGSMLAAWRAERLGLSLFLGEFGTAIGEGIPVREMFEEIGGEPFIGACLFCLQDFADPTKRYGLLRQDGSAKPALQEFLDYAREQGEITGGEGVAEKPIKLFLIPSGQVQNPYAQPGDGGAYATNEADSMRWFIPNKVLPLCRAHADWDTEERLSGDERGGDLTPLHVTFDNIVAYAKQHPAQRVLAVSLHSNSAAAWVGVYPNNYGGRFAGAESAGLLDCITDALELVHEPGAKSFLINSPGYIALPTAPNNLVCAIVEVAGHDTAEQVKWLSEHMDGLGQAVVDGVAAYLGEPDTTMPPAVDWQREYERMVGSNQALKAENATLRAWKTRVLAAVNG